ncbi:MAG: shikimate dehydrogenase [Betaproteobacteria bacterium]|nr:shikimate dehydrogenase [Betaproteobacteria bacterium]
MTDRYTVFGHPIEHSKSPRIHTAFAAQTGQDLSYTATLAPLDGFEAALSAFRAAGGRGANVTVPFKEEAYRLATRLAERARQAGAVNTLLLDGSEIIGDNTDGVGLVRDLTENLQYGLAGKRILVLGAGGATRGILGPILANQGAECPARLFVANRTAAKAVELARLFGCEGGGFDAIPAEPFDIVINATAASLAGEMPPLPAGVFAPGALAYDMMYGRETPFLSFASARGACTADGLGMLVEQAAEAFWLWRGVRPATAPVLAALRAELAGS